MEKTDINIIHDNAIRLISEWMLIAAGSEKSFNMMTASWGGMGYLWNKPVVFIFVRPERYTYYFVENSDHFTLSFFGKEYKKALSVCGSTSGRDTDKVKASGLTPFFTELGTPAFEEAELIVECKKMYAEDMKPASFLDRQPLNSYYGDNGGGMHKMYIGEIVNVWKK